MAACAQATIQKPHHGRARLSSKQAPITSKKKTKRSSDSEKKGMALGYRCTKSMTNLSTPEFDTNLFSEQAHGQAGYIVPKMRASCSALDQPLPQPQKPVQTSTLFGYKEQPCGQNELFRLEANVAYTTNHAQITSSPLSPPLCVNSPLSLQSHYYEQVDVEIVESNL